MDLAGRPSRRRQYVEMMHHRAMHQVNECLNVCLLSPRSEDNWTCVARDKRHLELFAKRSNTTQSVFFLGMNEIHCSFDEVYALLNYQTTTQFRLLMQLLYGRNFRDGALLSTHAPRDYDDDYDVADVQHSALWFTLQATRESLVGKDNSLAFFQALMVLHPDQSFITTATTTHTVHGASSSSSAAPGDQPHGATFARPSENVQKRTLALAWLPFYRDDDMEFSTDNRHQQESMRLKYTLIVEEVTRARLKLSCVAMSFRDGDDLHQTRSTSAARTIAKRLVNRTISRLEGAIIASRISRQTIVLPHQWVKNEDRVKCVICWKPFHSLIRRRHHCRLCGEVVCGSCCSLRSTNVLRDDNRRLEKVRVCHMCSNRGVGGGRPSHLREYGRGLQAPHALQHYAQRPRRSNSFVSASNDRSADGAPNGGSSTMDSIVYGGHEHSRRRVPILERARGGDEDDNEDGGDDSDRVDGQAAVGQHTGDSSTGYFGYIGAIMGATVNSSGQKIISLRSMTRADLIARSNSTASRASSASSAQHTAPRFRSPMHAVQGPPPPPPRFIGRSAAPTRPPPSPLLPPHITPFFGAVPFRNYPPSPPSNGPFSLSFLDPSVAVPERTEDMAGPMSIVADIGSHDRMSTVANAASHERSSIVPWQGNSYGPSTGQSSNPTTSPSTSASTGPSTGSSEQAASKQQDESTGTRFDPLRRTSMLSIAMLDGYRTSESEKVAAGPAGAAPTITATASTGPRLDPVLENHRLKLMKLVCSPACTLVDRVLMRECCERAALDCGVQGAFIARVEDTHVVLEHVVGTTNLSAIDHFLRADTPCDYVLVTPPTDRPFCITDCSADKRTSGMVMVKDVRMRFFAGVSILVRGLPIACLCVFSEGDEDDDAVRLSRMSATQYEFHVLEAAGQRISLELERLVHGMEIA